MSQLHRVFWTWWLCIALKWCLKSPFRSSALWEYPSVAPRQRRQRLRVAASPETWNRADFGLASSPAWFCAIDKLPHEVGLSLQPVHRVSAGLLWLSCTPAGSPCSGERSPARPRRSGRDRWRGSCRVPVWRHTASESWSRPCWSGDCCRWTGRTSGGTREWRWPWSPPPVSCRLPSLTRCYHAPLWIKKNQSGYFLVNSFGHLPTCTFD